MALRREIRFRGPAGSGNVYLAMEIAKREAAGGAHVTLISPDDPRAPGVTWLPCPSELGELVLLIERKAAPA
jgi:hypothetical protein